MKANRNLLLRTVTGLLFVLVMVLCMVLSPVSFTILFALITGLTTWEFCSLMNQHLGTALQRVAHASASSPAPHVQVNRLITTVTAVYFFFAVLGFNFNLMGVAIFVPFLISTVYLLISELYLDRGTPLLNTALSMMAWLYVALPFSLLALLAFRVDYGHPEYSLPVMTYSWVWPLSVFILLWVSDAGAYCCGSLFGRHKLFPRVSPHKTWEGSLGGGLLAVMVSQVLAGAFGTPLLPDPVANRLAWVGMAVVVVVFGTWGDLVESLFKRRLGIKDSGRILPGHGGMLDRFDSSLLAIPATLVYIYTLTSLS